MTSSESGNLGDRVSARHGARHDHVADATAATAQTDLTTAYNDAAGRTPTASVSGDIGGQTLTPGSTTPPPRWASPAR